MLYIASARNGWLSYRSLLHLQDSKSILILTAVTQVTMLLVLLNSNSKEGAHVTTHLCRAGKLTVFLPYHVN